mmetsp:Transcript_8389/g.22085  ORF Transcript_8389/g.22085 Transcript_8389/m.22085 type:complete len:265 (+) Transcript_8389:2119-2913(+)
MPAARRKSEPITLDVDIQHGGMQLLADAQHIQRLAWATSPQLGYMQKCVHRAAAIDVRAEICHAPHNTADFLSHRVRGWRSPLRKIARFCIGIQFVVHRGRQERERQLSQLVVDVLDAHRDQIAERHNVTGFMHEIFAHIPHVQQPCASRADVNPRAKTHQLPHLAFAHVSFGKLRQRHALDGIGTVRYFAPFLHALAAQVQALRHRNRRGSSRDPAKHPPSAHAPSRRYRAPADILGRALSRRGKLVRGACRAAAEKDRHLGL